MNKKIYISPEVADYIVQQPIFEEKINRLVTWILAKDYVNVDDVTPTVAIVYQEKDSYIVLRPINFLEFCGASFNNITEIDNLLNLASLLRPADLEEFWDRLMEKEVTA